MKCRIDIAPEMSAWRAMEKDRMVTSSTKNDGATGCGKAAEWKSQNTDFSTPLGNPANPAGFPLSHSPDDYGRVTKTGHSSWLRKGDTSNVVRRGTFLLSVDNAMTTALTFPQERGKLANLPAQRSLARRWPQNLRFRIHRIYAYE